MKKVIEKETKEIVETKESTKEISNIEVVLEEDKTPGHTTRAFRQ
jgi:hypothetical protein